MITDVKKKSHNSLLTLTIGIIVAIGRIKLQENNVNDLIVIMAVVNTVAFGFVITLMLDDIYTTVKNKITTSGLTTADKKRKKVLLEILFLITFFIIAYLGIYYVINLKSAKYNDAMSIIALSCSIANDGFIKLAESPVYKSISFIDNLILKIFNKYKNWRSNKEQY